MPNENHETYGGVDISTYTDDISGSNTFTNEQIEACVLSAGIAPYTAPYKLIVANFTHAQCTGGPNMYSPFYKESDSMILWYDEGGLGILENTNYWWYKHHIYVSKTGNKIATSLKVQNYRNFLEIIEHTWADIRGVTHKTYYPRITTKYGTIGDWHDSALQPALLIYNTTDGALAKSIEQTEPQSYWYWGGPSNVQNGMGGGSLFTRDLNTGTVSNDSYAVPWESATTEPIRIKEGGGDYTFPVAFVGEHITSTFYGGNPLNLHQGFNTRDDAILFCAFCGLKFEYNETIYKPLASGGVVYGYTNDMSEQSDWDNWRDIGDHEIPVTPPTPGPPTPSGDDDIDSMGFDGMSCSVGGPAKYYIMSYSDIHHLIGDFNAHAEPGTSISNNIISCYVNALDWNWSTGSEVIEIYSGGAQTSAFTSDMNYAVLSGYNARDIIGSIDVPRMTNTFYDFSPYSTYEVYVPFCGWVALPDTVAGRNIKVYFETDEATCGCKGRVFFVDSSGNGVTVAEITGSFGAPCPIQVIEGGLYKQAMLSNGLQVIGGIANGIMGGASGSGVLAVGGLSNAMQGLGNCLVAGNTNYGQTIGRAGDASGLMCAGKPYLKITYPPVDEVVNNNMFAHTVGYLCNTIGQLSNFHGFTVCANPHIHISATSAEKEEIKQLLEQGVILP